MVLLEKSGMSRIRQEPDGSYHWDCSIDKEYHRKAGRQGVWAVLIVCAVVFITFLIATRGSDLLGDLWEPLLVISVILAITLPLLFLWYAAPDPHEQYVMTEDYVKSGYGQGSIYSEFRRTGGVTITEKYIELTGKYRDNRIYVPSEDMEFIREFILKRLPVDVVIRRM